MDVAAMNVRIMFQKNETVSDAISATDTRHRSGFNQMVQDALNGKIEIKLAYLIQKVETEYRRNRRNKGLSVHWA